MAKVKIHPDIKKEFFKLYANGWPAYLAAKQVGVSPGTGYTWAKTGGTRYRAGQVGRDTPNVKPHSDLSAEARRALSDFQFFRQRYFGRISTPWQEETAYKIVELLGTQDKEYVVENAPPGVGKSTKWHDICAWLTCRNRAIRGLRGSSTANLANKYTGQLRRTFERTTPVKAKPDELQLELAVDAEATLVGDFGRFRPENNDIWNINEFVVAQLDDGLIEDKEPTWSSFGMDSGQLGNRYNIIIWDDLVTNRVLRTAESRERLIEWWQDEGETRIEPGGVLVLQGQRMGTHDLYSWCLKLRTNEDFEAAIEDTGDFLNRKYHHIVFKAHDDGRCKGEHSKDAPYYPEGCLLDPRRLPYRELKIIQANSSRKYRILYQQEDVDPENVLVNPLWISGGTDPETREMFPGCWDNDRGLCELPLGLKGSLISYAVADPSPTKYWSIQWWIYRYDPDAVHEGTLTGERYLMDLHRQKMDAPDLLDWNNDSQGWTGLMESWHQRAKVIGLPINTWIVEINAAQKFMLQYDHVHRCMRSRGVSIIGHDTHRNKTDPERGLEMMKPHYKYGRIRLPGKNTDGSRLASLKLINEATTYPESNTDDCVMAQWFGEYNLPHLVGAINARKIIRQWRPSWVRQKVAV